MTTEFRHETAKIYMFPVRAARLDGNRRDKGRPAANRPSQGIPAVDCGSGWYHEAAVQEADRSRKS